MLNEYSANDVRQTLDDSEVVLESVENKNRSRLPFLNKLDEKSVISTTYGKSTYKGGIYPNKTIDPKEYCRRSFQSAERSIFLREKTRANNEVNRSR